MKGLLRSKVFWGIVVVLVIIRLIAPVIIKDKLNDYLADFSPVYRGHVDSVGLSIIRGAYSFGGLELRLKDKADERFLYVRDLDISLAWRELLKARITTDIAVDGTEIVLTNNVTKAFKNAPKQAEKDTKEAARKLFPVRIERIDVDKSSFEFAELISIPDSKRWRVTGIEGRISNVTPTEGVPLMFITTSGKLFDTSRVKLVAQVNQQIDPLAWDADLELRDFELKEANEWLKRKMPITFTSGKLDIFAEARSTDKGIEGYVKPFLHKADIVAKGEDFAGLKHFGIEVGVAAANLILRTAREKTLATKVLFAYDGGEFKINSAKAISDAIKNGFGDPIPTGIDDEISLSKKAQVAKPKEVPQP